MGNPFEGWSKLNEGWDGGEITVEELTANAKTVAKNSLGGLLIALGMLWGAKLAVTLIAGILNALGVWVTGVFGTVGGFVALLGIPVAIVVGIIQQSLYRPMQLQAFEGADFVSGAGEAFKLAKEVFAKVAITMILLNISILVGLLGCGVGAVVAFFFFFQAPYLAATTELPPMECMRRSYELNKAYFVPVLIALAVAFIGTGVFTGCGTALMAGIGGLIGKISPPIGGLVAGVGVDLMSFLSAALILVASGAIFTTIQSVERGVPFKHGE